MSYLRGMVALKISLSLPEPYIVFHLIRPMNMDIEHNVTILRSCKDKVRKYTRVCDLWNTSIPYAIKSISLTKPATGISKINGYCPRGSINDIKDTQITGFPDDQLKLKTEAHQGV